VTAAPVDAIVERVCAERASAILRAREADVAGPAMEAAVRGGFRVIEFTLTTPGALERIAELSRRPDLLVGAGTVLSPADARAAVAAGARFLVSPVVDPEIVALARELGVTAVPGCSTPTELHFAHRAGAPLQKLFPAPAGGPDFVRAVLAPLPMLRIVPTNGVDETNAAAYLRAGAVAVGFTGSLFAPEWLADRAFFRIERRAAELLAAVREA
jgi:2-dehydro-3-deoxyphosphogluconate aldolase / (4S)-4-hydroxy-2-oxoglutarate aldolase